MGTIRAARDSGLCIFLSPGVNAHLHPTPFDQEPMTLFDFLFECAARAPRRARPGCLYGEASLGPI